jgi:hypothetical protein
MPLCFGTDSFPVYLAVMCNRLHLKPPPDLRPRLVSFAIANARVFAGAFGCPPTRCANCPTNRPRAPIALSPRI